MSEKLTDRLRAASEVAFTEDFCLLITREELTQATAEIERLTAENERLRKPAKDCYHIEGCPHWVEACQRAAKAEAENERLRNLAADLMDLVSEMPIKHPQQSTRRKILRGQCEQFGITQQTILDPEEVK